MEGDKSLTVGWYSAGVSSAVALKLVLPDVDVLIYQHMYDQHPDTERFMRDCEEWYGRVILTEVCPGGSVETVCRKARYISGPGGAACTGRLKVKPRLDWEKGKWAGTKLRYIWGFDAGESYREGRIRETIPNAEHVFPLIERGLTKANAHWMLQEAGLRRPAMYDEGFPNNNCLGCIKAGMGYWNLIRERYPKVFAARSRMERDIGASCVNGVYLDELDPDRGRIPTPIEPVRTPMCDQAMSEPPWGDFCPVLNL